MTETQWEELYGKHTWGNSLLCSCHPDNPTKSYCHSHAELRGIYLMAVEWVDGAGALCSWCKNQLGRESKK